MSHTVSEPLRVERATLDTQTDALRLMFGYLRATERDKHVGQILSTATELPLSGLWVGTRNNRVVAATLALVQSGKTAVISPPRLVPHEPLQTARELLTPVMVDLSHQGVRLAQALLEVDHGPDAQVLGDYGFRHVSNLLYLVSLNRAFPTSLPQDGLEFSPYTDQRHSRLAKIVERTYAGSFDCPELDGIRDIDDVLAGYRATGEFDPARWLIVAREGADVGCVLLTDHPATNQWELVYMGVVPEARGHAWGVAIARHAQWLTRLANRERLVLAVDAANAPAIAMYAAAGFVTWDHRSVFLRMF